MAKFHALTIIAATLLIVLAGCGGYYYARDQQSDDDIGGDRNGGDDRPMPFQKISSTFKLVDEDGGECRISVGTSSAVCTYPGGEIQETAWDPVEGTALMRITGPDGACKEDRVNFNNPMPGRVPGDAPVPPVALVPSPAANATTGGTNAGNPITLSRNTKNVKAWEINVPDMLGGGVLDNFEYFEKHGSPWKIEAYDRTLEKTIKVQIRSGKKIKEVHVDGNANPTCTAAGDALHEFEDKMRPATPPPPSRRRRVLHRALRQFNGFWAPFVVSSTGVFLWGTIICCGSMATEKSSFCSLHFKRNRSGDTYRIDIMNTFPDGSKENWIGYGEYTAEEMKHFIDLYPPSYHHKGRRLRGKLQQAVTAASAAASAAAEGIASAMEGVTTGFMDAAIASS